MGLGWDLRYYRAMKRSILLVSLLVVCGSGGCRCDKKLTDEERLKKKVDRLRVHVYVGAKDAVARGENSDSTKALVKLGKKVVALARKKGEADEATPAGKDDEGGGKLAALRSTLAAGKTLLKLRKTGKRMVRAGSEAGRPPFFPWWFKEETDEKQRLAREHAIMLATLFALKAHPEVPVPVPPALVLYEAARTDPVAVGDEDYRPPLHLIRSFVLGTNGLCDLAQKEADKADGLDWKPEKLNGLLKLIPKKGDPLVVDDKNMKRAGVALEAGAHGAIAICHIGRKQEHKALASLEKLVDLLEGAGVKSSRFQLVRAFSRCASGKKDDGKKALASIEGDDATKLEDQITRIKEYCQSGGDPGSVWDKLNLNMVLIRVVIIELRATRLLDQLDDTELFRYGRKVLKAFGTMYEKVKDLGKGDEAEEEPASGGLLDWTDLL